MKHCSNRIRLKGNHVGAWLFPALLIAVLLQNYYDLMEIFSGAPLALYAYEGPIIYKIGKDVLYISLLIAIFWRAKVLGRLPLTDYSLSIALVVTLLFFVSMLSNGPIIAALGVRWSLPLFLFLILRDWTFVLDTRAAARWLFIGMILCFGAQVYELFNMPPVFGELLPGVSARTPGIFLAPNSAAFFACASAACILVFSMNHRRFKWSAVLLSILISVLAQSGTGMVVSFLLLLRLMVGHRPFLFWSIGLIGIGISMPNLDLLTQRDDYVSLSGGGRIEVLADITRNSAFSISNFGLYTNAANLNSANPEEQVAADSLIASWIGNFGAASLIVLALLSLFIIFRMRNVDWRLASPCVIVFALFSMTTIVFEAFPMNIYIAIGLWSARKQSNRLPPIKYNR